MNAAERRQAILEQLSLGDKPVSATALAKRFGVSRQIVVGDVALLRASGAAITATPRGYQISPGSAGLVRQVACNHTGEQMEEELYTMVDQGCTVVDVVVEHPVYGQLVGQLELSSRYDVDEFVRRVEKEEAKPLSLLTSGVHLHTLRCPSEEAYQRVKNALEEKEMLLRES